MMDLITLATSKTDNGSYSTGYGWSPVSTWAFAIVTIGAILLFFSFLPGFINTIRTKDTASMSLSMWVVSVIGLTFLVIFYALGMANTAKGGKEPATHFCIVFSCEAASLILSIYVLAYKLFNMQKAKNLGITEKEYCSQLAAKSTSSKKFSFKLTKKSEDKANK